MKRQLDDRQLTMNFDTLFEIPTPVDPTAGSMDYGLELRHLISETLKNCKKDRFAIAGEMSRLTGREITKSMLDSWSAESRTEWRFPFEFATAFEVATGTYILTEFLARRRGLKVYGGKAIYAAEIGNLETQKAEINNKIKLLKQHLDSKH
ncbi:MAG: hypothetical protein CSYNP_03742 [Syntrophus sp. SKADARSKE-3]|nr:hypothetical protein [Syntrophus sp. SKADARSKE-3]